ncbi:MAG: alpha/beta fold hydrolase [Chitinophagales bacterium]|nr:alpha/beta fold hydrolase [Chitinophagales bacterium]
MHQPDVIRLQFSDGAASSISIFRSHRPTGSAVLVIFPAMGVKGSYYKNAAQHFAAQGLHVVTMDHRGHGTSSVTPSRQSDFGYKQQIETEYVAILEKVKVLFPENKVVIMGHSLGGQMGSMFISRYPHLADGIILNASCSPYYKGWGTFVGTGIWVFALFIRLLTIIKGYYPGNRVGFGGREAAGIIRDWCLTVFTNKLSAHGSDFDYEKAMRVSAKPVLGITYEGDTSAPPAAMRNLTEKFQQANVELHHLVPPPREKKFNHYSWAKKPAICDEVVSRWLSYISDLP